MASVIFVDKENGEPGTQVASKNRLKLGSGPFKALSGRSHVAILHVGKMCELHQPYLKLPERLGNYQHSHRKVSED